jgi:hypothetical protein
VKVTLRRSGSFKDIFAAEYLAGEKAVTAAMRIAAGELKTAWRSQVVRAGLGQRLANSVRGEAYPKGTESMNAAALVWTKAPKLIGSFNTGPLIRSRDGFYLAIPTAAAGLQRYGRKMTPGEWQRRNGQRLRFVYRRGKPSLLVADDARINRSGQARRKGGRRRRDGILSGAQTVVIFTLIPQVKLRKSLDFDGAIARVTGSLAQRIVAGWRVI